MSCYDGLAGRGCGEIVLLSVFAFAFFLEDFSSTRLRMFAVQA